MSRQARRFDPVNRCIYCGNTNVAGLTREHIVPIGLGGGLILPKASCCKCQDVIKAIETRCQRGQLLPYRRQFGLVRHPKELPETTKVRVDGEDRHVDPQEIPNIIILPELIDYPGI